jgi:hypothetical protein
MKVVSSNRRDLHAANFVSTALEFGICERECVAFNNLLSSARIAAQGELDSFKIASVNSVEDSVLLETCQPAGRTQALLDQRLFMSCFGGALLWNVLSPY